MDNNPTTRLSSPDQNARIDENATISNINTGGGTPEAPSASGTTTMTITQDATPLEAPVLRLTLRPQPHVSWNADVINNEGLGRKSSKRCCIFHKARAFGESSTESSEDDSGDDGSTSSSSSGGGGSGKARRPLVKKKSKKKGVVGKSKVPDYQRFHA